MSPSQENQDNCIVKRYNSSLFIVFLLRNVCSFGWVKFYSSHFLLYARVSTILLNSAPGSRTRHFCCTVNIFQRQKYTLIRTISFCLNYPSIRDFDFLTEIETLTLTNDKNQRYFYSHITSYKPRFMLQLTMNYFTIYQHVTEAEGGFIIFFYIKKNHVDNFIM